MCNVIFSCSTATPVPPAGLNYIELNAEDFDLDENMMDRMDR